MLKFFSYFFGEGDSVEFSNFTLAHFLPIQDKIPPFEFFVYIKYTLQREYLYFKFTLLLLFLKIHR